MCVMLSQYGNILSALLHLLLATVASAAVIPMALHVASLFVVIIAFVVATLPQ